MKNIIMLTVGRFELELPIRYAHLLGEYAHFHEDYGWMGNDLRLWLQLDGVTILNR